ncbi:hypothetical protein PR048_003567 [Dryococelus australis]|uniref:Uncharacterized protein n=1 Tax=Dryococelus australis TaxID=614101 RepID=A0ABQ9IP10_9NEOP|nr:hypothetical protein PR048_003567 [Dryococelus australis]
MNSRNFCAASTDCIRLLRMCTQHRPAPEEQNGKSHLVNTVILGNVLPRTVRAIRATLTRSPSAPTLLSTRIWTQHLKSNPVIPVKLHMIELKRCRERKNNIKASERVNVDVFTQNKRPCPQHSQTQFFAMADPAYLALFSAFEAEKSGTDKGDTATHIKCAIAAKRKASNFRAVLSSHCVYL